MGFKKELKSDNFFDIILNHTLFLFKFSKIPHQVLNAKPENLARENEIIAQAGKKYAVTIATNMAGRGTDIILGGNPIFEVKEQILKLIMESLPKNNKISNNFFLYFVA